MSFAVSRVASRSSTSTAPALYPSRSSCLFRSSSRTRWFSESSTFLMRMAMEKSISGVPHLKNLSQTQKNVPEFIQGISQFSVKGDKNTKLRFAFRIYDMDRDGHISNGELFQVGISGVHWVARELASRDYPFKGFSSRKIGKLPPSLR